MCAAELVIVWSVKVCALALLCSLCFPGFSSTPKNQWTLVRSPHFEVYSESGGQNGRNTALWLERLRAFFVQAGVAKAGADLERHGPVRVIVFDSMAHYALFRPEPAADAFFLSGTARDYLVLPALGSEEFGLAAHEYAHLVVHSMGVRFPAWLEEGIAEFFSTVRIGERESSIGGALPMRLLDLRSNSWIPLPDLLRATSPMRADRKQVGIFYAESWLLTDMLIFSPGYSPQLPRFIDEINAPDSDGSTISRVYGKSLRDIEADLRGWVHSLRQAVPLPGVTGVVQQARVSTVDEFAARLVLAELSLACGRLDQAETAYRGLAHERPDDAQVHAALGAIALRRGNPVAAREEWKRAMEVGIDDANLCYGFAILAADAGLPAAEIRAALERAIELASDFDDARYKLGLLEANSGDYAAALQQLRAIHVVPKVRAYAYWSAMASAYTDAEQRDAAVEAAHKALSFATTSEEHTSALRLAYVAATDLTVQVSRDANGDLQMMTARKPHGSDDWNPFIEPTDQIRRLDGQIRKVECESGKITGFRIETVSAGIEVSLPDPSHVLIQGGTPEFVCGAEDGRNVAIEYAAFREHAGVDGVLRGMRFR